MEPVSEIFSYKEGGGGSKKKERAGSSVLHWRRLIGNISPRDASGNNGHLHCRGTLHHAYCRLHLLLFLLVKRCRCTEIFVYFCRAHHHHQQRSFRSSCRIHRAERELRELAPLLPIELVRSAVREWLNYADRFVFERTRCYTNFLFLFFSFLRFMNFFYSILYHGKIPKWIR